MSRVSQILLGLLAALGAAWAVQVAQTNYQASLPWIVRQEMLNLSGLWALALMSVAMLMAARPAGLEKPLGGLDQMYRLHKWAAIWAGVFAVVHWLAKEIVGGYLKSVLGKEGKVSREKFDGLLGGVQHWVKDVGEWAFYFLLLMLVLALWRRFSYRPWRSLHKLMPFLYLALVFHGVLLAPTVYWRSATGVLLAFCLCAGVSGAVLSLRGHIGRQRRRAGKILALQPLADGVLSLRCQLTQGWPGHRPGQFVFLTCDAKEGAHPFTIASAAQGEAEITLLIKALGDYTEKLAQQVQVGQSVLIEGPYGCFDWDRRDRNARQIWVAGGIGVTPFLAWLDALQAVPKDMPAVDFHYCLRDREQDPCLPRVQALCAGLPKLRLFVHGSAQGERLQAAQLVQSLAGGGEIWMCGPAGLADALQRGLRRLGQHDWRWHQEAFALR